MTLSHRIQLDLTQKQRTYFAKAAGVSRLAYNWGLAEWKEQYAVGGKPYTWELCRLFNSVKDERFPFVREVTKCAPQSALLNLGAAFKNFFAGRAGFPTFKRKGVHDAFELSNDQFSVSGKRLRIPRLGWVRMRESLRFAGKVLSAAISCTAGRWFASITVETPDIQPIPNGGPAVGVRLRAPAGARP
jgi:putative transposase